MPPMIFWLGILTRPEDSNRGPVPKRGRGGACPELAEGLINWNYLLYF